MNEEEVEAYYKNRYGKQQESVATFGDGTNSTTADEITQQMLLPGVKDPNLWMIKCRIGEEKQTCLLLMRKFLTYEHSGEFTLLGQKVWFFASINRVIHGNC